MFANIKPLQPRDIFGKYVLLRYFLRATAVILTFLLIAEGVPAPAYAAAATATRQFVGSKVAVAKQQIHSAEVMQNLEHKMSLVKPADFVKLSRAAAPPMGMCIIDEVGRLKRAVPASDAALWRTQLHNQPAANKMTPFDTDYYVQRHIWLGEYLLGYDRAPREAAQQLRIAYSLTNNTDAYRGQADYDLGLCARYEHNFQATVDYLQHMLGVKPWPAGLDRADAASLLRQADGCLGYHQGNSRLGIPEPPVLDPLCGAASLAASLRSLGLSYDRQTVLSKCYVDEEGSNMQNLIDAGHKLGASVYSIAADDTGLELMPKPAIAFIENDHFVSVVRADKKGVGYLCSDCGAWPGGEVDLTWKQWHHMEPGIYGAVVRPGSEWDQFFKQLPELRAKAGKLSPETNSSKTAANFQPGIEVCSLPTNSDLHLTSVTSHLLPVAQLVAHLSVNGWTPFVISCGPGAWALHCNLPECVCAELGFGPTGTISLSSGGDANEGTGSANAAPAPSTGGPTNGDPVNLATGEEEYTPNADLTIYNPIGPAVSWGRRYDSLRVPSLEPWYEFQDFGNGWSQNYNMGVNDPTNGSCGPSAYKYLYLPNGGRILFVAPSVPTATNTTVRCQVQPGFAYLVSWNYNSSNGTTYYVITNSDRTQYVTSPVNSTTLCSVLTQVIDRNGNAIHFNYGAPLTEIGSYYAWPLLANITDSVGSPLLIINRAQDGTGAITSVDDRYGRTVYYHVGYYSATANTFAPNIYACDHVSQIEPTDTANPPDRYHYGYTLTANNDGYQLPKLATISVPNPAGSSTPATATIAYDPIYATVSSITDANGNETSIESVDEYGSPSWGTNYEKVSVTGARMPQTYNYTVSYNSNMAQLTQTDGAGNEQETMVYGDANNPYSPTTETDARGNVCTYTYTPQGYGDSATTVTPRGTTTTFTWSYSSFGLGELTQQRDSYTAGGTTTYKAPYSYAYYEPSGLVESETRPTPGTVDDATEVTYELTYNSLGDITQIVRPGNNSTSTITDTFGYGPVPKKGQRLSYTDNLGHVFAYSYDDEGNTTSLTDPRGITTYWGNSAGLDGYNIANQNILRNMPATGQTGSGNSAKSATYLYPGGPLASVQSYDESGTQVRQVSYTYGPEGEKLTVSGSTEFASYTYDGLYRLSSLTDANGHISNYYYNAQGYLDSLTYPGYVGSAPSFNTSTGTWSNITGADSVRNSSYNAEGDILTRIDGRGVVTSYTYNDPENKLTGVSYNVSGTSVPSQPNVSLSYDGFGRLAFVDNGVTQNLYGYSTGGDTYAGYDDNDDVLNIQTGFYESGSVAFRKNVSYTYYPNGSKATTVGPSGTFSYDYDAGGRPSSMTNPLGEATSWTFAANDIILSQTLANGAVTTYTRNALNQITELVNANPSGSVISQFSGIVHDAVGNRTSESATISSNTAYSGTTSYTYNNSDEMTDEVSTTNGGYNDTFAYDGAQNQTTFRSVSGKTYNSDNQISSSGYTFDGNGNPTAYAGAGCVFDTENRLSSVGSTFSSGYDAMDLRAWKTNSSGTTYYLYDSARRPICELNSSGTVTATNTFGGNGLVSRNTSSGSTFYVFDAHGNVTNRLNSTCTSTIASTTDAFGDVVSTSTVSDPFGYAAEFGYYTDNETGLVLTSFRYYDPRVGRYLNRDPIGCNGGVNIYDYTANDPANRLDPTGHSWEGDLFNCLVDDIAAIAGCILAALGTDVAFLIGLLLLCAPSGPAYEACAAAAAAVAAIFLQFLISLCVEGGLIVALACLIKALAAECHWFPDDKPAIKPSL